jgi:MFS transporter, PPP family, 3-phenylpropionic acid transporter
LLGVVALDLGLLAMAEPLRLRPLNLHDRYREANRSMARVKEFSTDHFALRLGFFYAAFFLFGGIQLPFFPLWLEARGLDARSIGLIIAAPTLVRIVATPIITHQADRRRALKTTLVTASIAATLAMCIVGLVHGAMAILVTFVTAAVAFSPMLSLTDAYALHGLGVRGLAYGPVRLWGSVAFIAGNVGAGFVLGWLAPGQLIWLLVAALAVSVAAAIVLKPVEAGGKPVEAAPAPAPLPKTLIRNRAFLAVALAAGMVQSSHAVYYGFSTLHWRSEGYDGTLIGVLWGIGVLAEVVLFAVSARLPKALHPTALLVIGGLGAIMRWTAMAFDPPAALLPLLQLLHACSFGAAHLGAMGFLSRAVPRELGATAQGFVSTWTGIVSASATAISGMVYAASGSRAYFVMAAMALVGVLSALYAGRCWKDY